MNALLTQAAFVGEMESQPFSDGVLFGHIEGTLPIRIDSLIKSAESTSVTHTTVGDMGIPVGNVQDRLAILTADGAFGRVQVALLESHDCLPVIYRVHKTSDDPVGTSRLGDFTLNRANVEKDGPPVHAISYTCGLLVEEVQRVNDRWYPVKVRRVDSTAYGNGASIETTSLLTRTTIEPLHELPRDVFALDFPEGTPVYRAAGGPGLPEEWRDGAVRLALDPEAVAAVDKAVTDVQALPRSDGRWQVLWPLGFLLLLMSVPVAIIIYGRWHAR